MKKKKIIIIFELLFMFSLGSDRTQNDKRRLKKWNLGRSTKLSRRHKLDAVAGKDLRTGNRS